MKFNKALVRRFPSLQQSRQQWQTDRRRLPCEIRHCKPGSTDHSVLVTAVKVQLLRQLPEWEGGRLRWATATESEQRFSLSKYYRCHAEGLRGQTSPVKQSKMEAINLSLLSLSAGIKWSVQELYPTKPQINGNLLCEKFMRQKQDLWYIIHCG